MRILREPAELDGLPSGLVRSVLQQRFAELSIEEPFDPAIHGFFVVVEAGDDIATIEQVSGCRLLSNRFSPARYGEADFLPDWELLEFHPSHDGSPGCFEMTFVLSDDGFGVVLLASNQDGIAPTLLALCRAYAAPSQLPANG